MRLHVPCCGLLLLLLFAPPAEALRCGNDLVREGDPAYRVQRACGKPDWIGSYYRGHGAREEVWHYNFGPNELIRVMRFREGRLQRIETAGRGFVEPRQPGSCRPAEVVAGMSAPELLQRCGEPVQRTSGLVTHHANRQDLSRRKQARRFHPVFVEDWYYEFGSSYLPRKVRLMDGIVAEIEPVE